jgi:hypothetical protein
MLVGVSDNVLYFSSQPIDGEGQWFSPAFSLVLEDTVTALDVMDGSLVIFMARRIYVTSGDIPSDNGAVGGIGTPRRLAVDVGSSDGHTLATSEGIFFRSDRGISLLTRGLSVEYVGAGVQDELASYPYVTAMALDTRKNLVRISLASALDSNGLASGTGHDVVFDMVLKKWIGIDKKHGTSNEQPSQASSMVYIGGQWVYGWLAADGTVYVERLAGAGSDFLDGSTWTTQGATTPWVHVAGMQGDQLIDRVLLLAKRATDHDVTISLAFDYVESFTESQTFTAAEISTLAREWLDRGLGQITSNAVKVRIEDATPSSGTVGTGEGAAWVALAFSGAPHRGPRRTSAAERGA